MHQNTRKLINLTKRLDHMERNEIINLLQVKDKEQEELFSRARFMRKEHFGNKAIVRGAIEVTDICRVDCDYCPMRKSNKNDRYLMNSDEIVEASKLVRDAGLKVVFLQGGEVPITTKIVGEAIPRIRDLFHNDVEILLCLGNKTREEYRFLKQQGADSYILKHETSNSELHYKMRHVTLDSRLECLRDLLDLGYKVGTGTIVGLPGQNLDHLADDIMLFNSFSKPTISALLKSSSAAVALSACFSILSTTTKGRLKFPRDLIEISSLDPLNSSIVFCIKVALSPMAMLPIKVL